MGVAGPPFFGRPLVVVDVPGTEPVFCVEPLLDEVPVVAERAGFILGGRPILGGGLGGSKSLSELVKPPFISEPSFDFTASLPFPPLAVKEYKERSKD